MLRSFSSRLNIEQGEGRLATVLLALAFCVGLARLFNGTASSTLLLVAYGAQALPYVYVLVAVVVPLIGILNTRLESRLSLIQLLSGNLGGYVLVLAGLWALINFSNQTWPVFAFAVWSEVGWVVTNLTLWGLAGRLLNVRQAKRLFGLIGAGGVTAAVAGGFLMPVIVNTIGTKNLLLASAAVLAGGFGLLLYAARAFSRVVGVQVEEASGPATAAAGEPGRSRYVWLIIGLGMISYACFYFVDNIFYGQVEQQFPNEADLAGFLGVFLASMNLLIVITNLFLVGPVMNKWGMRVGLLIMPAITAIMSAAIALAGWVAAAPLIIFWLATVNDLFDWVLRDTIFKSAVLILYQPLPPSQRLRVQTWVESVAQPIAQGLAGLALLGLGVLSFNALQLNYVLLLMLVVCVVLAVLLGRAYAPALMNALARRTLHFGGSAVAVADAASVDVLRRQLDSPNPEAILFALDKFEEIDLATLPELLLKLLKHDSPDVRRDVLMRLERLNLKRAVAPVRALLATEPDPSVEGVALRTLAALETQGGIRVRDYIDDSNPTVRLGAMSGLLRSGGVSGAALVMDRLEQMIESPNGTERRQAAQLLGRTGHGRHYRYVTVLLKDPEPSVRLAAVEAAALIKSPRLWPDVIIALADPVTREAATSALVGGGDWVLLGIRSALGQRDLPPQTARRLLRIVSRIRGEAAILLLKDGMRSADVLLRHQAIEGLRQCGYTVGAGDVAAVETAVRFEAAEAAQLLMYGCAAAEQESPTHLNTALNESLHGYRDRVLSLLSFIYDRQTMTRVRDSLRHEVAEKRAYGFEVLDALVSDELKPLVMPLVDDLSPAKRLQKLAAVAPAAVSPEAALTVLSAGRGWLSVCAKEMLRQLYPAVFAGRNAAEEKAMLTTIERVIVLRSVGIFAGVPETVLAEVADLMEEVELNTGETLFEKDETGRCLYIIVQGRLKVHDGERVLSQLDEHDVVGEMAVLDSAPRLASVSAETPAKLLKLDQDPLYELMADRIEVARGIMHVLTRRLRSSLRDLGDLQAQLQLVDVKRQ